MYLATITKPLISLLFGIIGVSAAAVGKLITKALRVHHAAANKQDYSNWNGKYEVEFANLINGGSTYESECLEN